LKFSNIWIGNTRDMLDMQNEGMRLVYEVTKGLSYNVRYEPRSKYDPKPFVQVGGYGFRLKSTDIHAEVQDA